MSDNLLDVTYVESNPLWLIVGWLLAAALMVIVLFLGACYLAGAWLAGRVERWVEARERREVQSRPVLR